MFEYMSQGWHMTQIQKSRIMTLLLSWLSKEACRRSREQLIKGHMLETTAASFTQNIVLTNILIIILIISLPGAENGT